MSFKCAWTSSLRETLTHVGNGTVTMDPTVGYPAVDGTIRMLPCVRQSRSRPRAAWRESTWAGAERKPRNAAGL